MRNWVRWCLDHKLKFVLYVALIPALPVYLLAYVSNGWDDFKSDFNRLRGLK